MIDKKERAKSEFSLLTKMKINRINIKENCQIISSVNNYPLNFYTTATGRMFILPVTYRRSKSKKGTTENLTKSICLFC